MKRGFLVFLSCLVAVLGVCVGQAMAVNVYGEGAYTDSDLQVCIYADVDPSEALRSFGVKLVYNDEELTYDGPKSSKNEAVWYLGDGSNNETYRGPEDVAEGEDRAVIIIGGKLDVNATTDKVSGNRVLLGTVWFTKAAGALSNPLTLGIGKVAPYANFVKGPVAPDDVLDGSVVFLNSGTATIFERGDANEDGSVDSRDIRILRKKIGTSGLPCWFDCNGDGTKEPIVDSRDIRCLRQK